TSTTTASPSRVPLTSSVPTPTSVSRRRAVRSRPRSCGCCEKLPTPRNGGARASGRGDQRSRGSARFGKAKGPRWRCQRRSWAAREVEPAEAERLVAERLDRPAVLAAEPSDSDAVDRDLVAGRRAVGHLDAAEKLGGADAATRAVPRTVEAPPEVGLRVPVAAVVHVAEREL